MSDRNRDQTKEDSLKPHFKGMREKLCASPRLKAALKTGTPLHRAGIRYTPATHIRRFSKAIIAYAAGVLLFLVAVMMLPKLFSNSNQPTPGGAATPVVTERSTEATTPAVTTAPQECAHLWVTTDNAPDCVVGCCQYSRCELCGLSETSWLAPLGHNYVDGICTNCGEPEGELPPDSDCIHDLNPIDCPYCACDEHVWTPNETPVTCTQGAYVIDTCIKCGYSVTKWQDATGHKYKDGVCTYCQEKQPDCLTTFFSNLSKAGKPTKVARKLTESELAAVKAFSDIPDVRMVYGAAYQSFYSPEEISLYELLYSSQLSKEIPDLPYLYEGSIMTVTRIREVIRNYTGIEVTQEMLDRLVADGADYFPDLDAYGFIHTDAGGLYPEDELCGYLTEDGKIILHVICKGDYDHVFILLVPTEDGYLIEAGEWVDEKIISGCHFSAH